MVRKGRATPLGEIFGDRLLVLGAHPDDCELMAGGLLARWRGARKAVIVTTMRESTPAKQTIRDGEIRKAMETLGITDWEIGPHPDAELRHDATLTRYFEDVFREFRPTLVVTHKPDDFHQDHRAISLAVDACLRRANATLLHGESYLWPLATPNLFVDISKVVDEKLDALRCYKSIISNETFDPEAVKTFHRMRGTQTFAFAYAEAYRLVRSFWAG